MKYNLFSLVAFLFTALTAQADNIKLDPGALYRLFPASHNVVELKGIVVNVPKQHPLKDAPCTLRLKRTPHIFFEAELIASGKPTKSVRFLVQYLQNFWRGEQSRSLNNSEEIMWDFSEGDVSHSGNPDSRLRLKFKDQKIVYAKVYNIYVKPISDREIQCRF